MTDDEGSDGAGRTVPRAREREGLGAKILATVARTCCETNFGQPHVRGCIFETTPQEEIQYTGIPRGELSHRDTPTCECGSVTMEDYAEAVITGDTYHVPKPNLFHRNRRCRVLVESDLMKLSD